MLSKGTSCIEGKVGMQDILSNRIKSICYIHFKALDKYSFNLTEGKR